MIVYASLDARAAALLCVPEFDRASLSEGSSSLWPSAALRANADVRISLAVLRMALRRRLADAGLKVACGAAWRPEEGVYQEVWGIGLTAVEARRALLRAS